MYRSGRCFALSRTEIAPLDLGPAILARPAKTGRLEQIIRNLPSRRGERITVPQTRERFSRCARSQAWRAHSKKNRGRGPD